MKLFLGIWVGVIIVGWVLLSLFSMISGGMGMLLLATLIIAALITGIVVLSNETDELRQRVKALEEASAPQNEHTGITTDEP